MSELGRLLEEARLEKELSLPDVEAAIRVRQKYLEALEQGNYAALPPGAIARGFLRNYARFLELDPRATLALYAQESGDHGSLSSNGHRPLRQVDYRPLEVELMREDRGGGAWRWVAALVLVVAVVAGAWWLLNNSGWARAISPSALLTAFAPQPGSAGAAAQAPRGTATATSGAALAVRQTPTAHPSYTVTPPSEPTGLAAAQDTPAPAAVAARPADTRPTPTSDLLPLPIPTIQPSPTPIPTATFTPTPEAVAAGISLTVKITQRSWVKVTADGNLVLQGDLLEAGQERGWQASQQITVLTGNAGGTSLVLNGQDLGTMGNVGQVVERTWVVEADKISEVAPNRPTATPGP